MDKGILILTFIITLVFIGFKLKKSACKCQRNIKSQVELAIEKYIMESYNFPKDINPKIDIKEIIVIDNKIEVLLAWNGNIVEAELSSGFRNNYRVDHLEKGSIFMFSIKETNKKKYLIIKGKNYDMEIEKIMALVENKRYEIDIPKKEYFVVYCEVPKNTLCEFPSDFQLFNKNYNNITLDVYIKYNK